MSFITNQSSCKYIRYSESIKSRCSFNRKLQLHLGSYLQNTNLGGNTYSSNVSENQKILQSSGVYFCNNGIAAFHKKLYSECVCNTIGIIIPMFKKLYHQGFQTCVPRCAEFNTPYGVLNVFLQPSTYPHLFEFHIFKSLYNSLKTQFNIRNMPDNYNLRIL